MLSAIKFNEMKSLPLVTATLLSITIGLSAGLSFAGDGRNGPELSGNAIPVSSDNKKLTKNDLKNALSTCDKKLLANLYSQIYKKEVPANITYFENGDSFDLDKISIKTTLVEYGKNTDDHKKYISFSRRYFTPDGDKLIIIIDDNEKHYYVSLQRKDKSDLILPYIAYDDYADRTYDELGAIVTQSFFVSNVKIILPSTGIQIINNLINSSTKRPVAIEINVEEYVNCILSGIQKKD